MHQLSSNNEQTQKPKVYGSIIQPPLGDLSIMTWELDIREYLPSPTTSIPWGGPLDLLYNVA